MTLVQALLRLGLDVPSPAELIGDGLGERVPGKPFLNKFSRVGSYGRLKALSVFGVIAATLLHGAALDAVYARITERQRRARSWSGHAGVERETASWVRWYNATRIHHSIGRMSPIEFEEQYRLTTRPPGRGCLNPASQGDLSRSEFNAALRTPATRNTQTHNQEEQHV